MTAEVRALRPGAIPPAEASKPQPTPAKRGERRPDVDWNAVEQEWRVAQRSNRELARHFGVHPSTITARAKREGWRKDLAVAVRHKAREKMLESVAGLAETAAETANTATPAGVRDEQIIDAAAARQVAVISGHRVTIGRFRAIVEDLITALAGEKSGLPNHLAGEKESAYDRASKLSRALRDFTALERQAWNVDANPEEIKPFVKLASRRGVPGHS